MEIKAELREKLIRLEEHALLTRLEQAEPQETLYFRAPLMLFVPEDDLVALEAKTQPGKRPVDDMLWRVGEIAGSGPNSTESKLNYHRVGNFSIYVQSGAAEAIAEILNDRAVGDIVIDGTETLGANRTGRAGRGR